jgi:hypothetical protein
MECDVEAGLALLMEQGTVPEPERVKALMGIENPVEVPVIAPLKVDLTEFDGLLTETMAEAV